jgi:hypothetical protein
VLGRQRVGKRAGGGSRIPHAPLHGPPVTSPTFSEVLFIMERVLDRVLDSRSCWKPDFMLAGQWG